MYVYNEREKEFQGGSMGSIGNYAVCEREREIGRYEGEYCLAL